jgi:hypothetical protein
VGHRAYRLIGICYDLPEALAYRAAMIAYFINEINLQYIIEQSCGCQSFRSFNKLPLEGFECNEPRDDPRDINELLSIDAVSSTIRSISFKIPSLLSC